MQRKRFALFARWPFLVVLLLAIVAVWQHQAIHDYVRLYNYTPPSSVVELADEVQLTDGARRLFYVNHPELQDRS